MSYATPNDMLNAFDANILGDVVSDTGTQVSPTALLADPKLAAALLRASGEVEAACLKGGMYTIVQLSALTGNAQGLLVDIICCVAMCKLLKRRPSKSTAEILEGVCKDARDQLKSIQAGELVFGGTTNSTDGVLPETTGPTTMDIQNLNMTRNRTRNYFPTQLLPYNR